MILRLQASVDGGPWGTLNTREAPNNEEAIAKTITELNAMQVAWSANYDRFRNAQVAFRVTQEAR